MMLNVKKPNFKLQFSQRERGRFVAHKRLLSVSLLFVLVLSCLSCVLMAQAADVFSLDVDIYVGDEEGLRNAVANAVGQNKPVVIAFTNEITLTRTALTIPRGADIILTSDNVLTIERGVEFFSLNGAAGVTTIFVDGGGKLVLDGIIVTHASGNGRGVEVSFSGTLELRNGEISGNTLSGNGGGVYNSGIFSMYGGMISYNTASRGGGVYNSDGTLIFESGIISNNRVTYDGGGVYSTGIFSMRGGEISDNIVTSYYTGGGVYNSGNFVFESGVISNNKAVSSGGGVTNTGTFIMSGGEISGNTAPRGNGGGVYSVGSSLKLFGGEIYSNTASNYGGGVYSSDDSFELSCMISGNTAVNGGGIYRSGGFSMSNAIVSDNHVSNNGGGVYKTGSGSTFTMYGSMISGNTAEGSGGGVFINSGNFEMFDGGVISDNSAPRGGGVYSAGLVHLYSGKVSGNYANIGGGVWVTDTYGNLDRLTVEADVEFSCNRANRGYNRQSQNDVVYYEQVKCVVWSDPFEQGYNNYDISYVRGSPLLEFTVTVTGAYAPTPKWTTYISDGDVKATVCIDAGVHPEGIPFSHWEVISGDVTFNDPTSPATAFVMPSHPVRIKANFGIDDRVLVGIELSGSSKVDYFVDESLDLGGLVVTAVYSDGSRVVVTDRVVVDPEDGAILVTVGDVTVTVSYTEGEITKSASFVVTVSDVLPSIDVGFIGYYVYGGKVMSTSFYWQTLSVGDLIDWVAVDAAYADWVIAGGLEHGLICWTSGSGAFSFDYGAEIGYNDFTEGQLEQYYLAYYVDPGYIMPSKPELTVNFLGVEGVTLEYYTTAWTKIDGKFDNSVSIALDAGKYTVRVSKGGMSYTFSNVVLGDVDVVLDVPVSTITVIGIAAECNLGVVQADWVYSSAAADVGVPNTFNVFDNGRTYEIRLIKSGFYTISVPGIVAGQTVYFGPSYFYQVTVPEGVTNVRMQSNGWITNTAKAGDVITLLCDHYGTMRNAQMTFDYNGKSYSVGFILDCSVNPFEILERVEPTLVSVTASAFVTKLNGNKNDLSVTITELFSDGTTNVITKTFSINNNAADTYSVGSYKVYVDTKGNTQIRDCYIV